MEYAFFVMESLDSVGLVMDELVMDELLINGKCFLRIDWTLTFA